MIRYRECGDPSSSRKSSGRTVDERRNGLIRLCDPTDVLNTSLKDIDQFPVVTCDVYTNLLVRFITCFEVEHSMKDYLVMR